jgi:hypothetical protein
VTNNCGSILDTLDVSITIKVDCNSSHIELVLDNKSLTAVWFSGWSLVSSLVSLSESRTELASRGQNIVHRLQGFHYCVSRIRYTGYTFNTLATKPAA